MLLSDRWIRRLTERPVNYVVTYHPDQHSERSTRFWSEFLDVPERAAQLLAKPTAVGSSGAHGDASTACW
jgi:hypothetical protein